MQGALHIVLTVRIGGSVLHTVLACDELAAVHGQADIPVVGVAITLGLCGKHGDGGGRVLHPNLALLQTSTQGAFFGFEHVLQLGVVNRTFTQGLGLTGTHVVLNGGTEERDGLIQTFHAVLVGNGGLHGHGRVLRGLGASSRLVVSRLGGVALQDCNTGVVATNALGCRRGSRCATGCRRRAADCLGLSTAGCEEGCAAGCCEQAEGGSAGEGLDLIHGFSLSVVMGGPRGGYGTIRRRRRHECVAPPPSICSEHEDNPVGRLV